MRKMSILELDGHEYEIVDKEARERLDKMEPGNGGPSTGGGINTVEVYSKLPTDANENDVAIVETEEYVRTESETVVEPVKINAPVEGNDYNNFVHAVFKNDFGFLLENEELKASGAKTFEATFLFDDNANTSIQINELSAEAASIFGGVDHAIGAVVITTDDYSTSYIKIMGLSVKDFAINMMGLELPDEIWPIFLGPYANDNSADSPVYNWAKFIQTAEPVNENSIDMGGMYGTVLYDYDMDLVLDAPIESVSLRLTDETYENTILDEQFDIGRYSDWINYDTDTQNAILMYSSLIINHIAYDKEVEKSIDIYNHKGLFQYDNGKWASLEEKMNTPRFVDTYADLPKTSIENGIMAVAKESSITIAPNTTTTVLKEGNTYRLMSANSITLEDFNAIVSDISPDALPSDSVDASIRLSISTGENTDHELYIGLMRQSLGEAGNLTGVIVDAYFKNGDVIDDNESKIHKNAAYFIEFPQGVSFNDLGLIPPVMGQNETPVFNPEVEKWYWLDVLKVNGDTYAVDGVIHEGFFEDYLHDMTFEGYVSFNGSIDVSELDIRAFNFNNASEVETTVYPAGFYRYNNNEWNLVKAVSGDEFANKNVLKLLTKEDLGNIDENTAARHIHDNQYTLDKFGIQQVSYLNRDYSFHGDVNIYPSNEQLYGDTLIHAVSLDNSLLIPDMREIQLDDANNEDVYIAPTDNTIINVRAGYSTLHITLPKPMYLYGDIFSPRKLFECYIKCYYRNEIIFYGDYEFINIPKYSGSSGLWATIKISSVQDSIDSFTVEFLGIDTKPAGSKNYNFYDIGTVMGQSKLEGFKELVPSESSYANSILSYNELIYNGNNMLRIAHISPTEESYLEKGYASVLGDEYVQNTGTTFYDTKLFYADGYILRVNIPITVDEIINCSREFEITPDTNCEYLFYANRGYSAKEMIEEGFNTSDRKNFDRMFYNTTFNATDSYGTAELGPIDTSNGESFVETFMYARFTRIGVIDMRNAKEDRIDGTFSGYSYGTLRVLREIEKILIKDISAITFMNIFGRCSIQYEGGYNYDNFQTSLQSVIIDGNVKVDSNAINLSELPNLSVESLVSIFESFMDNTGEETQYTVTIGTAQWEKLTEEQRAIVTNKNIILAQE